MDPYFRPILISVGIVVVLSAFLSIPVLSWPLIAYPLGGCLAVYLFNKEQKEKPDAKGLRIQDATYLGLGAGLAAGAILALLNALSMQDAEVQRILLDEINKRIEMQGGGLPPMEEISSSFVFVLAILTILISSALSFLGSVVTMTFLQKRKK